MKLGVVFPRTVIGVDTGRMRDFTQAAETAGFDYLQVGEHVLGVDPATRAGWADEPAPLGAGRGLYDYREVFHEPLVFLGWMAQHTTRLELMTATLTLPMRQTCIVAKQAAQIDLLSGERLILGVGVGWNAEEYAALGAEFHNRGRRIDEQIDLLRALWTREVVTFHGQYHTINGLGINPLPRRSIPIWIGGGPGAPKPTGTTTMLEQGQERVLRRVALRADGWLTGGYLDPVTDGADVIDRLRRYAADAGRALEDISIQGSVILAKHPTAEQWWEQARSWRDVGATHLALIPANAAQADPRFGTFDGLVDTLAEFRSVVAALV